MAAAAAAAVSIKAWCTGVLRLKTLCTHCKAATVGYVQSKQGPVVSLLVSLMTEKELQLPPALSASNNDVTAGVNAVRLLCL